MVLAWWKSSALYHLYFNTCPRAFFLPQTIHEGTVGQNGITERVCPKDAHPGHSFKRACEQQWREMTGNPRWHQNTTYPSLSICFSEHLNGVEVAICLNMAKTTLWVTIKDQLQNGGGVGCAPAGAGFSLKLYGDVNILPSQSIPNQSWLQGVRSLLSLLAADEDFSMDMLIFDRFVCSVSVQQWTAQ